MDDDYGYDCEPYEDDLYEWETEQVFQDHEGREDEDWSAEDEGHADGLEAEAGDDCGSCYSHFDDSCQGCPGYARAISKADPNGVYNAQGECIGDLSPMRYPY